jgi:chromosome segregation ATPase
LEERNRNVSAQLSERDAEIEGLKQRNKHLESRYLPAQAPSSSGTQSDLAEQLNKALLRNAELSQSVEESVKVIQRNQELITSLKVDKQEKGKRIEQLETKINAMQKALRDHMVAVQGQCELRIARLKEIHRKEVENLNKALEELPEIVRELEEEKRIISEKFEVLSGELHKKVEETEVLRREVGKSEEEKRRTSERFEAMIGDLRMKVRKLEEEKINLPRKSDTTPPPSVSAAPAPQLKPAPSRGGGGKPGTPAMPQPPPQMKK